MHNSIIVIALALLSPLCQAEVVQVSETGFIIQHETTVARDAETVFAMMTDTIAEWWNPAHSFSGISKNLSLDQECFCERWEANRVVHLDTVVWIDNSKVILTGGLGPLKELGLDGTMIWSLASTPQSQTVINWKYYVNGFSDADLSRLAPAVDDVLKEQISRLATFSEE